MKKFFIILVFLPFIIFGQNNFKLKGVVTNSEQLPLQFANIILEPSNKGTTTDKNGLFEISISKDSDSLLIVSFIGYEQKRILIDSIKNYNMVPIKMTKKLLNSQTILVEGINAKKYEQTFTLSTLDKQRLSKNYTLQDVPEMISNLPSTMFYSEGGSGIGYNYLNIRGFDQRRISVSVNGIPQNEPEDHNVYWLDMPDILANTELIQIQRGAGSGISGYPSIGGSINIITSNFSERPVSSVLFGIGDYNTRKYGVSVGSGIVDNKYSYYFSLSNVLTSGYRDNSWADFKSFYLSAVRFDDKVTTQINIYGGLVKDGLAYTGLPKFAITDKNLRRMNHSYWSASETEYSYELFRRPEEKEEFFQPHFEILNEINLTNNITLNSALFLIIGNGYFDYDASWADSSYFRLTYNNGFNPTSNPGNAIIRAMVENKQWGWIPRISYKHPNGELIVGAEVRIHRSIHWGSINYAENLPLGVSPNFRYYYYEGGKDIYNLFINENYKINDKLRIAGEIQLAYNKYLLFNEKYQNNDFEVKNLFLNPRFGLNYKFNSNISSYFSIAYVSREPRLKNYYDAAESSGGTLPQFEQNNDGSYNYNNPLVKPEKMLSLDLGVNYKNDLNDLGLNFYFMQFNDEIISNGQLDRFGQPITGNMNKTLHYGIEFSVVTKPYSFIEIIGNINVNKNYISEGFSYIEDPNTGEIVKQDLSENLIGGFPNVLLNAAINFSYEKFSLQLNGKYLGKFYSDNYYTNLQKYLQNYPNFVDYSDNVIDSYFVANLQLSYDFSILPISENIKLTFQVNNLFDKLYASYAYGKEFFPGAERNIYFATKVEF